MKKAFKTYRTSLSEQTSTFFGIYKSEDNKVKDPKNPFSEIIAENFPNLVEDTDVHV